MAKMAKKLTLTIFLLLSILAICALQVSALGGGMLGRRTKIKDVKTNKEVQELGRYCVEEYNRSDQRKQHHHHHKSNGGSDQVLMFSQVVEAEKQVVSGIKYYLKISATDSNGVPKTFDAVVVVKPWMKSRELVGFAPSPATK